MSRRRKRKATNPVLLVAMLAGGLYVAGWNWTEHRATAMLVVSVGLIVFAYGKWRINRLQDRWAAWKRRHRERLEAFPAVALAAAAAVGGLAWVAAQYLAWVVGGILVAVAVIVVGVLVARRRGPVVLDRSAGEGWSTGWSLPRSREHNDPTRPVYFGWQADQNDQGRPYAWKIGISWDTDGAWAGFDRGNALPVIKVGEVVGGYPREQAIHRQLRRHRIPQTTGNKSKEWFYDRVEVRKVVDDLCAEAGVDNPFPHKALAA